MLKDKELSLLGLKFHPYHELSDGELWSYIRFAGPPAKIGSDQNTFPTFPANLVAAGLVPAGWLAGKIILVGSAYEYSQDQFLTPYFGKRYNYPRMNGVEIHANVLNSLLSGEFYYLPDTLQKSILIAIVALLAAFLSLKWSPVSAALGTVAIIFLYLLLAASVFRRYGLVIPVLTTPGAAILSIGLSMTWRTVTEGRQKRFIKSAFARYVPPAVVEQMITDPSCLVLGGEKKDITSMFPYFAVT